MTRATIKYPVIMALTLVIASRVAVAQQSATTQTSQTGDAAKLDSTTTNVPLSITLGNGWFIQAIGGSEGEVILVFKSDGSSRNKFVQCVFSSDNQDRSVNVPGSPGASC